ncbi:MAG: sugar phosphate nucleotidyltransferase [candidate division KSB1 bacterium]|nr:sugar phosphate nucleotidyltransferase [candidate division KSB1 bacterium]MDZ7357043.1 sugar phosphate nucleotidyltransferase [candidate division KSB1 bacterium]MDZ7376702.1 sugar phosphate nucleotidyltransferase [candidate division KSB1 bacterium]MDZ7398826.1 sugar phosphate nucleotidyltransferase [candidate division KSB1 bacterium]
MQAIILAGGKGTRLRPYTTIFPKPLMPINDMPILEVVIRQLKKAGFKKITMAVGHLAELIEAYFGNGSKWGMQISYSREDLPLGTAGPLALVNDLDETFLVMNGDVLSDLDYTKLIQFHRQHRAITTIAMYDKEVKIDLGIIKTNDQHQIIDYIEKPTLTYQVSMGIYVFDRKVMNYIPFRKYFDLPDLILALIRANEKIVGYHFKGYWRDIGRREDYELAVEEFEKLKNTFIP